VTLGFQIWGSFERIFKDEVKNLTVLGNRRGIEDDDHGRGIEDDDLLIPESRLNPPIRVRFAVTQVLRCRCAPTGG
jgi:hypothetical protein